jgi:hypothetical protein
MGPFNLAPDMLCLGDPLVRRKDLGTYAEWSYVRWFVASVSVGFMLLELFLEFVGLKSNPRQSLVYLRNGILLSLLFSMIHSFGERLLQWPLLLTTALVVFSIVASGVVNRRFSRTSKLPGA